MQLTKKLEKEILIVMEEYWSSYLKGDLETWASYLPDHYRNIGTTKEEIWNSKQDILDYTERVIDQMVGMFEMRNKTTQMVPYNPYIMVHELGDLYVNAEEGWIYYAPLRLSSLLEKTDDGWKILHQHGSFPDSKADEGEAFGFDQLKVENKKLRDAIQSRTLELERKNQELEMEAALERVRAVAMAMHEPKDILNICEVVFNEMEAFGFEALRNAIIHVFEEDQKYWIDFDYSVTSGGAMTRVPYTGNSLLEKFIRKIRKTKDSFFEMAVSGVELRDWKDFRQTTDMHDDPQLDQAEALYYYVYSVGEASIGISSYQPITPEQLILLKRFRNVFDLAYGRYGDIRKAEAQTREAKIESALERVRAKSMAMHQSEDLADLSLELVKQVQNLGIDTWFCAFNINDGDEQGGLEWGSNGQGVFPKYRTPREGIFLEYYNAGQSGETLFIKEIGEDECPAHYEYLCTLPGVGDQLLKIKEAGIPFPTSQIDHVAFFKYGYILFITFEPVPESHDIFKRFAKVFEQTYTRFLDLQKAEALAREAQIEAALERVRAASMAMHKTNELANVVTAVSQQFQELGLEFMIVYVGIYIYSLEEKYVDQWFSPVKGIREEPLYVRLPSEPWEKTTIKEWREGKEMGYVSVRGDQAILQYARAVDAMTNSDLFEQIHQKYALKVLEQTEANHKYGNLSIVQGRKATQAEQNILKRFAKTFEQSFTRFLDLQKAEEQAREAQIEASLERVRAQTMAMHNSEDVGKCIVKMFDELTALGVDEGTRFGIGILNHDNENNQLWTAYKDGEEVKMHIGNLDMTLHPLLKSASKAWKEQVPLHRYVLEGEDLLNYYQMLNNAPAYKFRTSIEKLPEREFHYGFVFDQGFFYAFNPREFQPDLIQIIQRFSSQFGQTYRRYLDLAKAEEQAREALIEAALEKVRSSSLAVNKVDEFNQVVQLVFEKLGEFQIPVSSVTIATLREGSKDMVVFGCGEGEAGLTTLKFNLPYFSNAFIDDLLQVRAKSAEGYFSKVYSEKDKNNYYDHVFKHTELRSLPEDLKEQVRKSKSYGLSTAYSKHSMIMVNDFHGNPLEEDQGKILIRFSNVFEQAYIRFLDLQKAEAQAREGQIEAALERVRSRTMGMQKSEELKEVIQVIFEQFVHLKILVQHTGFLIDYKNRDDMLIWLADENAVFPQISIPYFDSPHWNSFLEAKEKGLNLFSNYLNFEDKNAFYEELFTHIPDLTEETKEYYFQCPGLAISTVLMDNVGLYIENFEGISYADEENNILLRFGKVFQQTYTRFLDLQRAESQAREAQIEAALERTRTQSMLMQHSDELNKVSNTFHEQLLLLGLPTEFSYVWLPDEANQTHMFWATWSENHNGKTSSQSKSVTYPLDKSEPYTSACYTMWESDQSVFVNRITPEEVINFFSSWGELLSDAEHMKAALFPEGLYYAEAYMKYGCFGINIARSLSEEEQQVLFRFSIEFERAYTRFLDLKKAEAQAREGRIEAALEKVRSRTMAMQSSDELPEAANLLFLEIQALGIPTWSAGYNILSPDNRTAECWMSSEGTIQPPFTLYFEKEKSFIEQYDFFRSEDNFLLQELSGKALEQHYDYMKSIPKIGDIIINLEHSGISLPTHQINHLCKFEQGYLLFITYKPVPEAHESFIRFTKVFEQTYTRFLDLKKAEAQARESQIEAALERVRSQALAMQSSNDLIDIANELREQMGNLGQPELESSIIHLYQDGKDTFEAWWAFRSPDRPTRQVLSGYAHIPIDACEYTRETIAKYKSSESEYVIESRGQKLYDWYKTLEKVAPQTVDYYENGQIILPEALYYHHCKFSGGALLMISNDMPTDEVRTLQKRTAKVFDFAYRRFLDLQNAEQQAQEAIRQASLDRVRGEIASMRTPDDLQRITPLIWRELNMLKVPFFRCGVFIMDEDQHIIHAYLSTPSGEPLAAMDIPYDHSAFVGDSLKHWRARKIYTDVWDQKQFVDWTRSILDRGFIENSQLYQAGAEPPMQLVLQYVPFNQGMLYVGSEAALSPDQIQLVKALAETFSIAYARYEDFNNLEKAKQSIESTLTELKTTQAQLIQSEKMASLGELTAGIAHEIQNPLNFVNNFSEVSGELVQEAKEEIEKGELKEAAEILSDLTKNLEKITHHGGRASSIVKGMLDHSRSSTGEKELVDINALCDEYLRLAYHGMRAKDKGFNAGFETHFDENLPKINVIPQDIGRVVLNIINNAFQACLERSRETAFSREQSDNQINKSTDKQSTELVTVSTTQMNNLIQISIADNGPGIPDSIKDKIFQPFFTTKPTGQGTGLGLSLSYDIVKAHGGKLEVKNDHGAEFVITIPI